MRERVEQRAERPARGEQEAKPIAPLAEAIGHTRFIVLGGVFAVLLTAAALFLFGAGLALWSIWNAVQQALQGQPSSTDLTVQFLEIVSTMLKAVVFYLIGVGFYSLFIAPLNLPVALGVETLNDLESKVVSVIVVIMAITFLEHFILWENPLAILQFGIGFAAVSGVLVLFQFHAHHSKEDLVKNSPALEERAHVQLFSEGRERREVSPDDFSEAVEEARGSDGRSSPPGRGQE
jgi:uncharacterized membrane protein YqhA